MELVDQRVMAPIISVVVHQDSTEQTAKPVSKWFVPSSKLFN